MEGLLLALVARLERALQGLEQANAALIERIKELETKEPEK